MPTAVIVSLAITVPVMSEIVFAKMVGRPSMQSLDRDRLAYPIPMRVTVHVPNEKTPPAPLAPMLLNVALGASRIFATKGRVRLLGVQTIHFATGASVVMTGFVMTQHLRKSLRRTGSLLKWI